MYYRTSGVHGSVIGRKVAHWIDKNYFQPVAREPPPNGSPSDPDYEPILSLR